MHVKMTVVSAPVHICMRGVLGQGQGYVYVYVADVYAHEC